MRTASIMSCYLSRGRAIDEKETRGSATEVELLSPVHVEGNTQLPTQRGAIASEPNPGVMLVRWFKRPLVCFFLLAVLSLPLRLFHLDAPLTGAHEFRQTQTALSVWEIKAHGFSWLHPKLPLFGPPWECPFEYPVFQTVAAGVDEIAPWKNLDTSLRVTSLMFYYLTALTLFLLCRRFFRGTGVALFTAAVFLFSPYHMFWSRTSMIEYAATFFALGYLLWFLRWAFEPRSASFGLCLLFGALASLTKITTLAIPLLITATVAGLQMLRWFRSQTSVSLKHKFNESCSEALAVRGAGGWSDSSRMLKSVLLACLIAGPILPGYLYTKYGDGIKERSGYTAWLSSSHPYLKEWNYGTVSQRLSVFKWKVILSRAQGTVLPTLAVAMILGFSFMPFCIRGFESLPRGNIFVGAALALAPLAATAIFFNLYWVHTYYFIAGAPFLAICAGLGLGLIFHLLKSPLIKLVYVLLLIGLWLQNASPLLAEMVRGPRPDVRVRYLEQASKAIEPEEPVIIVSSQEWSPFAAYYLKRRAFMAMLFNKPVNIQPLVRDDYFKKNHFHWLLVEGSAAGMAEMRDDLIKHWKFAQPVSVPVADAPYSLYRLSD